MEFRSLFSDNPFIFMGDFEQAVKEGYRVVDSIAGYPQLQGILKECKVFKTGEVGEEVFTSEAHKVTIVEYCPIQFLKQCQSVVLGGYEVDTNSGIYGIKFGSPHRCTFVRTEMADVAIGEQELKEIDKTKEDVVASETPAETQKRGRKPKKSAE